MLGMSSKYFEHSTSMNKYFIKKIIIAKNIKQALKLERKAEVAEIYQDYNYIPESKTKMGFNKEKL